MSLKNCTALIVDDQESICESLAGVLSDEQWDADVAYSGKEAVEKYKTKPYDLVFLDVWMDGIDGIKTLQLLREINDRGMIVIMSGHATIETAVKATKLGAFDFLEKPLSLEKLLPILSHARDEKIRKENKHFLEKSFQLHGISDAVASIHRKIKVVAPRNSWIFITGENGTGKEVVARNIHMQSLRADKAFVAVNCAAIPEDLIESELFGYKKGAFTNAIENKIGKFELAHKGTLFLDEIGDMSLKTQAKILRILQEQTFERVGDTKSISVDVRVIAATNKDLFEAIENGSFREDLYYRLNVIPIHMPALRDRVVDIPILANYFLEKMTHEIGVLKTFSKESLLLLQSYLWPGNVRELKNLVERLTILVHSELIEPDHILELLDVKTSDSDEFVDSDLKSNASLKEARNFFERKFIVDHLELNEWNVSKTADAIGIERSNLHRKLKSFKIDPKRLKE